MPLPILAVAGTAARGMATRAGSAIWAQRANATRWAWNAAGGNKVGLVDRFAQQGFNKWNQSIAAKNAPPVPTAVKAPKPVKPPKPQKAPPASSTGGATGGAPVDDRPVYGPEPKPKRAQRPKKSPEEKKEEDEAKAKAKADEAHARALAAMAQKENSELLKRISINTEDTVALLKNGLGDGKGKEGGGLLGSLMSGLLMLGPLLQGGMLAKIMGRLPGLAKGITNTVKSLGGIAKNSVKFVSEAGGNLLSRSLMMAGGALDVAKGAGRGAMDGLKGVGGKLLGKAVGKSLMKKIPIIGALAGIGFGAHRVLKDKDWVGGFGELASGLVSTLPIVGTAASIGIDGWLAKRDWDKYKADQANGTGGGGGGSGSTGTTPPKPDFSNVVGSVSTTAALAPASRSVQVAAAPRSVQVAAVKSQATALDLLGLIYELMNDPAKGVYTREGNQSVFSPRSTQSPSGGSSATPYSNPATYASPSNHRTIAAVGYQGSRSPQTRSTGDIERDLLDALAVGESGGNYDKVYGGSKIATPKALTDMTIDEVLAWQDKSVAAGSKSSAAGKYQFIRGTLRGIKDQLGLSGDTLFNQATQDQMAVQLMRNGGYDRWRRGEMSDERFNDYLASQWASWKNSSGRGTYDGDGLNTARHGGLAALQAIRGNGGVSGGSSPVAALVGDVQTDLYAATQDAVNRGVRYKFGAKNSAQGGIDCSGWVSEINRGMIDGLNLESNKQAKDAKAMFQDSAAGIIQNVSRAGGGLLTGSDVKLDNLREGMLIGEDNGNKGWDAGRYQGIDHITQVVRDPNTGELMISQSSGSKGVSLMRAEDYLQQKNRRGTRMFATDALAAVDSRTGGALAAQSAQLAPTLAASDARAREASRANMSPVVAPVVIPQNSSPAPSSSPGGSWGSGSPVITRNPMTPIASVNQGRMAKSMA